MDSIAAPTSPRRRDGDLAVRLLTAAVGIPILLVLIWLGGPPYTVAVTVILAIGAWELTHAAGLRSRDPLIWCGVTAVAALALTAHIAPEAQLGAFAALASAGLLVLVFQARIEDGFHAWSAVMASAVYVGALGSTLVSLRLLDDGRDWVLLMLFTTFATDTGAYAVGRTLGRRKLAPHVSPAKTLEGAAGGLVAGATVAVALNALLGLGQHPAALAALGLAAALAAELGDLAESLLKRALGVKDMGRIFPGHGGALDRLDSVLFVAPVIYFSVKWIIH